MRRISRRGERVGRERSKAKYLSINYSIYKDLFNMICINKSINNYL